MIRSRGLFKACVQQVGQPTGGAVVAIPMDDQEIGSLRGLVTTIERAAQELSQIEREAGQDRTITCPECDREIMVKGHRMAGAEALRSSLSQARETIGAILSKCDQGGPGATLWFGW